VRLPPAEELEHLRLAVEISKTPVAEIVVPERRHTVVDGFRLHHLDWGTEGRPPILFLHGGALNAHTWDVVCLAMRKDYHCLALDQRGHGDSEWSPELDYTPQAHRRDILGLVDRLGLDRFLLVGQSMGALNAFTFAAAHPDRLRGLVLIDAGPSIRSHGAARIGEFVGATAEIESIDEALEKALSFNPKRDPRLLRRSLLYNYRRLPSGKWARKHDMRHWLGTDMRERAERHQRSWDDVERVTCPTLVVRGGLSDVFHDEDAESFAAALPDGRWVRVENAGHTVQGDNPRELCEKLREFFDSVEPGEAA
jgi:pimeloyl-ACP methyl ester carboxylesterase